MSIILTDFIGIVNKHCFFVKLVLFFNRMNFKFAKRMLPKPLIKKIRLFYYAISNKFTYLEDCLYTTVNSDFTKDPSFVESYNLGKKLMQESWGDYDFRWRAYVICWAGRQAKDLDGDFIECGVNTGMYTRMIINFIDFQNLDKKYYLLDTFNGMDEKYSSKDEMIRSKNMGYTKDIYSDVKKTFQDYKNIKIIKGPVPETLDKVESEKVAFLSIDMNCVMPEISALEFFWDKIIPGGIILIDDYGFPGHEDQRDAHNDFASRHNTLVLPLPTGQGLIIR